MLSHEALEVHLAIADFVSMGTDDDNAGTFEKERNSCSVSGDVLNTATTEA